MSVVFDLAVTSQIFVSAWSFEYENASPELAPFFQGGGVAYIGAGAGTLLPKPFAALRFTLNSHDHLGLPLPFVFDVDLVGIVSPLPPTPSYEVVIDWVVNQKVGIQYDINKHHVVIESLAGKVFSIILAADPARPPYVDPAGLTSKIDVWITNTGLGAGPIREFPEGDQPHDNDLVLTAMVDGVETSITLADIAFFAGAGNPTAQYSYQQPFYPVQKTMDLLRYWANPDPPLGPPGVHQLNVALSIYEMAGVLKEARARQEIQALAAAAVKNIAEHLGGRENKP